MFRLGRRLRRGSLSTATSCVVANTQSPWQSGSSATSPWCRSPARSRAQQRGCVSQASLILEAAPVTDGAAGSEDLVAARLRFEVLRNQAVRRGGRRLIDLSYANPVVELEPRVR